MTETTLRLCDGHTPDTPDTFLQDPAFEGCRDMLTGMVRTLESDILCIFGWLKEGLDAGGQLAFISMMLATADYDNDVHPRHILADLWHAYDRAGEIAFEGAPAGTVGPAEFRRRRALAAARRPDLIGADA